MDKIGVIDTGLSNFGSWKNILLRFDRKAEIISESSSQIRVLNQCIHNELIVLRESSESRRSSSTLWSWGLI